MDIVKTDSGALITSCHLQWRTERMDTVTIFYILVT